LGKRGVLFITDSSLQRGVEEPHLHRPVVMGERKHGRPPILSTTGVQDIKDALKP
jgi:hypothetical protein